MLMLPADLLKHTFKFLDYSSLKAVYSIKNAPKDHELLDIRRSQYNIRLIPDFILKHISTHNIRYIDIGKAVGATGYIDFLRDSHFKSNVVYGIDVYRRFFISIKSIKTPIKTMFQRYTDDKYKYVICGNVMGVSSQRMTEPLNEHFQEFFNEIKNF